MARPTISQAAYDHLRRQIIRSYHEGKKSRINTEAQLHFIKRYRSH